jgi:acyl-CoA synthetase (AMP-forming)/AMP-acid ligase II
MKGYYRAPEETAAAVDADGWFNTRDLARLEGRNLFVVGRTKDLIVHSGFNVYPGEVEGVLNAHFGVMQSAVIGRPVAGDEEVIAFVQLSEGAVITPTDLAQHAAKHLAPYKWPSEILILPKLPLTPTGKIAKAELRKMVEDHLSGADPFATRP